MSDVTVILERINNGDADAEVELFTLVYDELCRIAHRLASADGYTGALSPDELVHATYIRLKGEETLPTAKGRNYFFAAIGHAMRRVRVDHYRTVKAKKRGGDHQHVELETGIASRVPDLNLAALDAALERLAATHPKHAQIVELRFFAGLTMERAAKVANTPLSTAERYWKFSKAWLLAELQKPVT